MFDTQRVGFQPRFDSKKPGCLSPSEVEILKLLAKEGLSDKEIAGRLFISVKTVAHHMSHILCKLGVASRVCAVIWAWRTGFAKQDGKLQA